MIYVLRILKTALISGFVTTLVACCAVDLEPARNHTNQGSEYLASKTNPRGVCVIIHGLNQLPETMDPIAHHIQQLGYHTYRITLRGHERSTEDTFRSSAWEHDLESALHDVTSKHPHLPLHIIGYSLGGLLTTRVIDQASKVTPASVILLAPALSLRAFPQVGYVLTLFPQQVWSIPNIAPRYYRRFARTPVFWYQNTFELYSKTRTLSSRTRLSKIPTLVIANPRDELVSFVGLRSWLRDNSLEDSWRIEPIRPKPKNPFIPEHVIIDENSLGNSEWNNLRTLMKEFLFATNR